MDALEIIRQLEHDDALRAELRAVLLSEELLDLPRVTAELVQLSRSHDERLARLETTVAELVETARSHDERLARLETTAAHLLEVSTRHEETLAHLLEVSTRHEETLTRLEASVAGLLEVTTRHDRNIAQLRGWQLEMKWREYAMAYLGTRGFRKVRLVPRTTLEDMMDGLDDERSLEAVLLADAVFTAVRKETGEDVYLVTEVASRIHVDDVERALTRARLMATRVDRPCLPVVAGASADDAASALAAEDGVLVVVPKDWGNEAA